MYFMNYEIIKTENARILRKSFIDEFIDKSSEYYIKNISDKNNFCEYIPYRGYLWDCYNYPDCNIISFEVALKKLGEFNRVFIMSDLHDKSIVSNDNYFKFPIGTIISSSGKSAVKQISSDEYCYRNATNLLPEDIYVFDDSLKWHITFTHESTENSERYCLFQNSIHVHTLHE